MGYVWVQLLNYLLSLIVLRFDFTPYEPSIYELRAFTVILETYDTSPSAQCLDFFQSQVSWKGIRLLIWGMSFKVPWLAAAFWWKEGKKMKQNC